VIRVCLHGAESTGKSALAARLGYPWVAEYGRAYCEAHGTDLAMADLLAIAEGQDAAMRAAAQGQPEVLVLDTDPLMTAAWAMMLFGEIPPALLGYAKADLYLLFAPDVPWVDDGTRIFGSQDERTRFAAIADQVLVEAGVPYVRIWGDWAAREALARAAIAGLQPQMQAC
jgi:NadR type nicotinamide-nucleotide adenylyltransferase